VREIERELDQAPHWTRAAYLAALDAQGPLRVALVALEESSGTIVGFTIASLIAPVAELETIAVASEFKRRGIARSLLAAMTRELMALSAREIVLEVRASNSTAIEFYRAEGFTEAGRRPGYYAQPVEDAFLFRLGLG
jgi:ribosomal-protein-alanine N-acetyltransferase